MDGPVAQSTKAISAETVLKKLTDIMERLHYVVMEGCFDELRELVRQRPPTPSPGSPFCRMLTESCDHLSLDILVNLFRNAGRPGR